MPNIEQQVDNPGGIGPLYRPPACPGIANTRHPVGAVHTPARTQAAPRKYAGRVHTQPSLLAD